MTQPASSGQALPVLVDALAAEIVALYARAEAQLVEALAAAARKHRRDPGAVAQLAMLSEMRRAAQQIATELRLQASPLARRVAQEAARNGAASARHMLEVAVRGDARLARLYLVRSADASAHGLASANAIALDLARSLDRTTAGITRFADDAYRAAVADAATRLVIGREGLTPATAQHAAWDELTRLGITGFTDTAGRRWNLGTYVEMATRTATQRAYNAAHQDRMTAVGIRYFTISHDGHPCPQCRPWEGVVLSTGGTGRVTEPNAATGQAVEFEVTGTVEQARTAGLWHPNCFPAGTVVSSPSAVHAADSRWYEGEIVVVHTSAGDELSVTPNHPVLTPEGWVAAGQLAVGQNVLRYSSNVQVGDLTVGPDDQLVPTPIGEVFDALRKSRAVTTVRVPAAAEQFHGDGEGSDVDVVLVDSLLQDNRDAKSAADGPLLVGAAGLPDLPGLCSAHQFIVGAFAPANGGMSGSGIRQAFLGGHGGHASADRLATIGANAAVHQPGTDRSLVGAEAFSDLALTEPLGVQPDGLVDAVSVDEATLPETGGACATMNGLLADAEDGRQLARALALGVAPEHVVKIERRQFAGHVYNLQTGDGWYVAGGIVVHNCRHVVLPYLPGVTKVHPPREWTDADQANYDATQKLRALERAVRAAKRQEAAALTDLDRQAARRRIRAAQAQIREHVDRHGLVRRSRREQLDLGNR